MKSYNKLSTRVGILTILSAGLILMIGGTYGISWLLPRDIVRGEDDLMEAAFFVASLGAITVIVSMIVWRSNTSP